MTPKQRIIPIFVPHLGCPHCCVFCNQRRITGSDTPPDGARVTRIIEQGLSVTPPGTLVQAAFYGGSFTAVDSRLRLELLRAANPFVKDGRLSGLRVSTRPDAVDREILRELKEYGVDTVELGVQSMDDAVLSAARRGHTASDVEKAAALVKEAGLNLVLQMMCGLPRQTDESALASAKRLAELEPDGVRIYPAVVLQDSELADLWRRGEYVPLGVSHAASLGAKLLEVFELGNIPVIRFGLNPSEALSGGAALAGAYHPALGELVYSELFLIRARTLLAGHPPGKRAALGVNAACVSFMAGHKGKNRQTLMREFGLSGLGIYAAPVDRREVVLLEPR